MKDPLYEVKRVKVIGLDNSMPKEKVVNGELHTNNMIFLLKRCIIELEKRIDLLTLEIAELKGQVEPE